MSVYKSRVYLRLEIEDYGSFEISSFGTDSFINSIPTAVCSVGIGRNLSLGSTSSADKLVRERQKKKAKVYFRAQGPYDNDNDWPEKELVVFEGRLEGASLSTVSGSQELVVALRHWLAYLDTASTVSSMSHPTNPLSLTFSSVLKGLVNTDDSGVYAMAHTAIASHFDAEWPKAGADLWGDGFKPMFWRLLNNTDFVEFSESLLECMPDLSNELNTNAIDALKRIAGESTLEPDCSTTLPDYGAKLALLGNDSMPEHVVRSIASFIGSETIDGFASQTIWGKLLSFAGQFQFAVIPLVSKALVVPFTPALQSTYCKTLTMRTQDSRRINLQLAKSLRGVATFGVNTGTTDAAMADKAQYDITGCFSPEGKKDGLIWVVAPPPWLANAIVNPWAPSRTSSLLSNKINSAITPIAINKNVAANPPKVIRQVSDILNGYAHNLYALESLRGRMLAVSEKLRFDIAPGSTVRILADGDPFIVDDALADELVGVVTGVTIAINSDKPHASTNYQVEFFRTTAENANEQYTVERHPLYESAFTGAPLIDELSFGDC